MNNNNTSFSSTSSSFLNQTVTFDSNIDLELDFAMCHSCYSYCCC